MKEISITYGVIDSASADMVFTPCESMMAVTSGKDERTAIVVKNADAARAVGVFAEAGDGIRSSIGGLLVEVPSNSTRMIMLDSMRFKKLDGINRGKFVLNLCKAGNKSAAFEGNAASISMTQIRL